MRKEEKIAEIMNLLSTTYKEGSGPYQAIKQMLSKKASKNEISSLWVMLLTSRERG